MASSPTFAEKLDAAVAASGSLLCVGLDPDPTRFPAALREQPVGDAIATFNRAIIDATKDVVCAYKPNLGFFAAAGLDGIRALIETRKAVPSSIPVILDCKVGDMASTASAYARAYFEELAFDAVTANPFLGEDSLAPFFAYPDRGVFVLSKTSNPGSGELQDLVVAEDGAPIYRTIATRARRWQRDYPATVGLVVGATYPRQLGEVREAAGNLPILVPGVGAQAGDVQEAARQGLDNSSKGLLISSSRGITYAGSGADFAERARDAAIKLRDQINAVRSADS